MTFFQIKTAKEIPVGSVKSYDIGARPEWSWFRWARAPRARSTGVPATKLGITASSRAPSPNSRKPAPSVPLFLSAEEPRLRVNSQARLSSPETPTEVGLAARPLKDPKERQRHIKRHVAELFCLLIFIATVLTGGMLQGDESSPVMPTGLESSPAGSNSALRIAHLVLATALSISILWHVFVLRRRVTRLVKRRRPGNRVALARWMGFLVLYCASFATGIFVTQPSRAQGHIAISLIFLVCLAIHLFKRVRGRGRPGRIRVSRGLRQSPERKRPPVVMGGVKEKYGPNSLRPLGQPRSLGQEVRMRHDGRSCKTIPHLSLD